MPNDPEIFIDYPQRIIVVDGVRMTFEFLQGLVGGRDTRLISIKRAGDKLNVRRFNLIEPPETERG